MAGPSESGRPNLSLSMIVRNEAHRLNGFLDALGDLVDEVCITDTGSDDGTTAIAHARGCRVQEFSWCDDFSAARNAALQPCTGRWILSLDADELIAPEDHFAIHELVRESENYCYRFVTRNYTDISTASGFVWSPPEDTRAAGFPGWFPSAKVRLFPNLPGIGFEGQVHELIHRSLEQQGVHIVDSKIPIHHYPLLNQTADERARKQALYLELGKRKVAEFPDDARARHELGDQYVDLGEITEAFECYKAAVRLDPGNPLWLRDLGGVLLLLAQVPQAVRALELSLRLEPENEEAWRNLGVARAREENWIAAQEAFRHAHTINSEHPENLRYLAIACQACGNRAEAVALLKKLLDRYPAHAEGRTLYERLMETP